MAGGAARKTGEGMPETGNSKSKPANPEPMVARREIIDRISKVILDEIAALGPTFPGVSKKAALSQAFYNACNEADRLGLFGMPPTLPVPPQHSQEPLPETMTTLWKNRQKGEYKNPVDFVKKVYSKWLYGLTRADIHARDPELYNALTAHIRIHGLPKSLDLPTQREVTNRRIANAATQKPLDVARALMAVTERERRARTRQP